LEITTSASSTSVATDEWKSSASFRSAAAANDEVDKLVHLAWQKIALTQEIAKHRMTKSDPTNAGRQRDQVLLTTPGRLTVSAQRPHLDPIAQAVAVGKNQTA